MKNRFTKEQIDGVEFEHEHNALRMAVIELESEDFCLCAETMGLIKNGERAQIYRVWQKKIKATKLALKPEARGHMDSIRRKIADGFSVINTRLAKP
jgi:hypothetical protein